VVIGLLLATAAAVGFGSGTFVQHLSCRAVEHPREDSRTRRGLLGLLARLARQPRWLLGQVLAGAGMALQFGAMALAPVAVVQPVIAAGLPVALTLEVIRERRAPQLRLVAGMALCVAGLVVFVFFSRARSEVHPPGIGAAAVLLALAIAFAFAARFVPSGPGGALISGVGAGGGLGVATVCAAVAIHRFQAYGLIPLLTHWSPYLAAATGFLATAATQQAYARGALAWSLPALTVGNTLVATAISVLLVHERLDLRAAPAWTGGALLAVIGVTAMSILHARRPSRRLAPAELEPVG
jgi:drug/metabolite transporter (DMT)-like permease